MNVDVDSAILSLQGGFCDISCEALRGFGCFLGGWPVCNVCIAWCEFESGAKSKLNLIPGIFSRTRADPRHGSRYCAVPYHMLAAIGQHSFMLPYRLILSPRKQPATHTKRNHVQALGRSLIQGLSASRHPRISLSALRNPPDMCTVTVCLSRTHSSVAVMRGRFVIPRQDKTMCGDGGCRFAGHSHECHDDMSL